MAATRGVSHAQHENRATIRSLETLRFPFDYFWGAPAGGW